jgi:hypothetical protein
VYIDAEYSQLQPGVRLLALALMNIFNTERRYSFYYMTFFCTYRASFYGYWAMPLFENNYCLQIRETGFAE